MSDEISALLKQIEKKLDLRVGPLSGVSDGVSAITTGNLAIDYITGVGGIPLGRSVELFGLESSGKTSCALQTAAELQKIIIAEGLEEYILYADYEHALDRDYASSLGLDVDHPSFLVMQPDTLEQGANAALSLLDTNKVRLSIWDSVASMNPDTDKDFGSNPMGAAQKAKLMSDFLRLLNSKLHKYNCSALFLNHVMDVIETGFAPRGIKRTTTPGGRALKFYASVRIEFQKVGQVKTEVVNELTNETENRVESMNIKVKVVKNKIGPPFRECTVRVRLGKGFDNFLSAVQVLLAYNKITTGGGGYYYFDAMPELEHVDMERSAKGRMTLRSERALLEFAENNSDWAKKVTEAARDLLPMASLPPVEGAILNEFSDTEDNAVPPKFGITDLNSFAVSSEEEKTD